MPLIPDQWELKCQLATVYAPLDLFLAIVDCQESTGGRTWVDPSGLTQVTSHKSETGKLPKLG